MRILFIGPSRIGDAVLCSGLLTHLTEAYPAARAVFDEVDEALGESLSALIWEGDVRVNSSYVAIF